MEKQTTLKILYRDEHYVAVDKPAGLLVHRSPISAEESEFALQLLRDQIGQVVYPCHRLDRPTSGVLLFALDKDCLRFTQKELANQGCDKIYQAVVRGWAGESGEIDYDLKSEEAPDKIQSAQTHYRTLARSELPEPVGRYPTARFSLLELSPRTGRKHQLRRHMAHLRHPILGDTRHGDGVQNRFLRAHCGIQRLMLRAERLCFTHGKTKERITLQAAIEAEFQEIVAKLGF
ncbi:tRNA pseudouridine(65) synthase TruC [Coraliomargarita sinensis]|uniref:tRNA pseudouridine synthase C n=1 Tax=Coraliomargarita sinensis TaxID=2174842 RepID=A0A317ZJL9_9BACT|nr:pseudouridine synthase [Coraliomargarita sinensis]PXA04108.1 tRNA pseudouridine(65) synthase TruC [Coraliomargarita sinensis]